MTTASLQLRKFRAFLNLEALRSLGSYAEYLGYSHVKFEDWGEQGHFPQLTQCADKARDNLFSLAARCLKELGSSPHGPAEFLAMERILIDHAEKQLEATKYVLRLEEAPRLTRFGMDICLEDVSDQMFESHLTELHLWLDKERLDYQEPASADDDKLMRSGRPPAALWDKLWAEMGAQLYIGDLKPENQARIEKAMLDWAAIKEIKVSESSVRTRARLLWVAISKEDKN